MYLVRPYFLIGLSHKCGGFHKNGWKYNHSNLLFPVNSIRHNVTPGSIYPSIWGVLPWNHGLVCNVVVGDVERGSGGPSHLYPKGWRSRDRSLYSGGLTMGEKKEVCGCDLQFFVGMVGWISGCSWKTPKKPSYYDFIPFVIPRYKEVFKYAWRT